MMNFLPTFFFYRRLISTDEYSYRYFFYKREHLVFSNLKIHLVYLFDFKLLKLNKTMSDHGKRLFF